MLISREFSHHQFGWRLPWNRESSCCLAPAARADLANAGTNLPQPPPSSRAPSSSGTASQRSHAMGAASRLLRLKSSGPVSLALITVHMAGPRAIRLSCWTLLTPSRGCTHLNEPPTGHPSQCRPLYILYRLRSRSVVAHLSHSFLTVTCFCTYLRQTQASLVTSLLSFAHTVAPYY